MDDIIFDKVAISTIFKIYSQRRLPEYDPTMANAIKLYLKGKDCLLSYGWLRKFSSRYLKKVQILD